MYGKIDSVVQREMANSACVEIEDIKPDVSLKDDLGLDSIDMLEITTEIEAELGIEISDENLDVETVEDFVKAVRESFKHEYGQYG